MDFLNQASGQFRELMLSMTPAARVTALLLLGVIGVSLGYLVQHQSSSPDDFLFNGEFLPASVVDRAEAEIARAGLAGYQRIGNRIKVPSARKAEFLAAVADGGALPLNYHEIMEKALGGSPFESGDTRRGKVKSALQQQLSMMVTDMAGIEKANVIFDIQEPQGLSRKGTATATVSVHPTPGEILDARQIKMIRKAVAGGVAELSPEHVVVTNSGDGSFFGGEGITGESFENEYYRDRLAFEQHMRNKIERLLPHVPGVRVEVTAELESTLEQTEQTMSPEGESKPLRETTQLETDTLSEVENGGRPGPIAQGPLRNNNDETKVTVKNEKSLESTTADNFVGQKREFRRGAALVPEDIRVAITVPTNYLLSVWREEQRLAGEDPDQPLPDNIETILRGKRDVVSVDIKNTVMQLLPGQLAEDKLRDISVVFMTSLTPEEVEGPSTATQALGWASKNFNTMTMAVVALVSLMMLRSMVKSIPAAEPAAALGPSLALDTTDTGASGAEGSGDPSEGEPGQRPRLRLKKGESLKDDLVEIVREDPDAAAAILRSWISNAG